MKILTSIEKSWNLYLCMVLVLVLLILMIIMTKVCGQAQMRPQHRWGPVFMGSKINGILDLVG